MTKPNFTQELAQVMNALGWNAGETRVQCAVRVRDNVRYLERAHNESQELLRVAEARIDELNLEIVGLKKSMTGGMTAAHVAVSRVDALLRAIRKLAAIGGPPDADGTLRAISPSQALATQTAVWDEFERLRKEHEGLT